LSKKSTIVFLLVAMHLTTVAQLGKSVHVHRDPRVDKLVEKQIEINNLSALGRIVIEQGYRLLVISTNKRDQAMEVRSILLKEYPDHKSYMSYQAPNFKVHFGNFKTYRDADKIRTEMARFFSTNILVVPSKVELRVNNQETINRP
jgi:hypothetical protein